MYRIDGEIVIGRSADVVFDYVADQSNEPQYNPYIAARRESYARTSKGWNRVPFRRLAHGPHR